MDNQNVLPSQQTVVEGGVQGELSHEQLQATKPPVDRSITGDKLVKICMVKKNKKTKSTF